ncbi:MAG: hypothetical protein ACPGEG_00090 [Salibacteraceae bacterium]
MRFFLLTIFSVIIGSVFAQSDAKPTVKKDADFSVRANWNYQFFTFSGKRTNSTSVGGIIEKRINYESTMGISINYITRMEDADEQSKNFPQYNEVVHISPFFRKYFDRGMSGPYTAFALGMGIPMEKGVQWDVGGHVGYLLKHNNIAVDFLIQMGFGSFRYSDDQYSSNGLYLGSYSYVDYGFFFRPGVNIGFAF